MLIPISIRLAKAFKGITNPSRRIEIKNSQEGRPAEKPDKQIFGLEPNFEPPKSFWDAFAPYRKAAIGEIEDAAKSKSPQEFQQYLQKLQDSFSPARMFCVARIDQKVFERIHDDFFGGDFWTLELLNDFEEYLKKFEKRTFDDALHELSRQIKTSGTEEKNIRDFFVNLINLADIELNELIDLIVQLPHPTSYSRHKGITWKKEFSQIRERIKNEAGLESWNTVTEKEELNSLRVKLFEGKFWTFKLLNDFEGYLSNFSGDGLMVRLSNLVSELQNTRSDQALKNIKVRINELQGISFSEEQIGFIAQLPSTTRYREALQRTYSQEFSQIRENLKTEYGLENWKTVTEEEELKSLRVKLFEGEFWTLALLNDFEGYLSNFSGDGLMVRLSNLVSELQNTRSDQALKNIKMRINDLEGIGFSEEQIGFIAQLPSERHYKETIQKSYSQEFSHLRQKLENKKKLDIKIQANQLSEVGFGELPPAVLSKVLIELGLLSEISEQSLIDFSKSFEVFSTLSAKDSNVAPNSSREKINNLFQIAEETQKRLPDNQSINQLVRQHLIHLLWEEVINYPDTVNEIVFKKFTPESVSEVIHNEFIDEYAKVEAIKNSQNPQYNGPPLNWMQALTTYRFSQRKVLPLFSPPGAGKTLAALYATQANQPKGKVTLIVTNNSTVSNWSAEAKSKFPEANVVNLKENGASSEIPLVADNHNYLVINYDSGFSVSDKWLKKLKDVNIDNIVFDEVHLIKGAENDVERVKRIRALLKRHSKAKILAMTATPCINSTQEAANLIQTLTSEELALQNKKNTVGSAVQIHNRFVEMGMINYNPVQSIENQIHKPISKINEENNRQLIEELSQAVQIGGSSALPKIEAALLKTKLQEVFAAVDEGQPLILYSEYTDGGEIIRELQNSINEHLREKNPNQTVALYTAQDKTGLQAFKEGKAQILIATSPLKYGVDGLQEVCNKMIILSPPWSQADMEQLTGRIARQGQNAQDIHIIVPQVEIKLQNGQTINWDQMRMERILNKGSLNNAIVRGTIPGQLPTETQMLASLRGLMGLSLDENKLDIPSLLLLNEQEVEALSESEQKLVKRIQSNYKGFTEASRIMSNSDHSRAHAMFQANPELLMAYHGDIEKFSKNWSRHPIKDLSSWIMTFAGTLRQKREPHIKIGDFGCGPNNLLVDHLKTHQGSTREMQEQTIESLLLSRAQSDPGFISLTGWKGFEVTSVDHINYGREDINACDMGDLKKLTGIISPKSLDLAVFSLSIKRDYKVYLNNAKELLRDGGTLFIALPADSWWQKRKGDQGERLEDSQLAEMINYLEELNFKQTSQKLVADNPATYNGVNIYQDTDQRFIYIMLSSSGASANAS